MEAGSSVVLNANVLPQLLLFWASVLKHLSKFGVSGQA